MLLKDLLSKKDAIYLLELIQKSLSCTTKEELKELLFRLKELIPYNFAIYVFAKIDKDTKTMGLTDILNISYPAEWLNLYTTRKYHEIDPIFKTNFTEFKLQYWNDTYQKTTPSKDFKNFSW